MLRRNIDNRRTDANLVQAPLLERMKESDWP